MQLTLSLTHVLFSYADPIPSNLTALVITLGIYNNKPLKILQVDVAVYLPVE
jgi:hypothetical protein